MAKEIVKGEVPAIAAVYEIKVEDSKLKVHAEADLAGLVDKAAQAVPGDSPVEALVIGLIKQGLAAL